MFIWENPTWPRFTWDRQRLERPLMEARHKQGLLLGRMNGLGPALRGEAVVETLAQDYGVPLTADRLLTWSGADWREGGHAGAPPAEQLDLEMTVFLHWFNGTQPIDQVLKAGLAHLWFAAIHPFEDGNGRVACAITDLALARSEEMPERFYSLAAQIAREREDYDSALAAARRGALDITDWLAWFLGCLARAIDSVQNTPGGVLAKTRFWDQHRATAFNARQRDMLNRLLEGFDGKLTTSNWATLVSCSQDTAHRDILDLIAKNILRKDNAGGRSTSYAMTT